VVVVMGGGVRLFLSLFLPVISFPAVVDAGIVVNELYYDHPGTDAGHEFVEILNTGSDPVPLDGLVLEFHNGSGAGWSPIWRAPDGIALASGALFVVGGTAVIPLPDSVFELALQNGPDAIRLLAADGATIDVVAYGGLDDSEYAETTGEPPVGAGQAIARMPDGKDDGDNAADFAPATPTPGRRNVARHDAAPILAAVTPPRAGLDRAGIERAVIDVVNLGLASIPAAAVVVVARDSSASGARDIADTRNVAPIEPGGAERVAFDVALTEFGYHWITFDTFYGLDERAANDRTTLVRRVGNLPLLVSEIMTAPRAGCPQFVELYNAGAQAIDLVGFGFRDMRSSAVAFDEDSLVLRAHEFLLIAADAAQLRACAPGVAHIVEAAGAWPAFNKSGGAFADSILVLDALGIPVQALAYPGVESSLVGHSLERIDLYFSSGLRGAVWRLSREVGGSPGRVNQGALEDVPASRCDVSPNPFSPARGDVLRIAIAPSLGVASVVVRIYDASGRRVADVGTASAFPAVLLWDGRGLDGELVRSGVYVLACEALGADGVRVGVEKVVVGCANHSP